jgi:hypothetical protein
MTFPFGFKKTWRNFCTNYLFLKHVLDLSPFNAKSFLGCSHRMQLGFFFFFFEKLHNLPPWERKNCTCCEYVRIVKQIYVIILFWHANLVKNMFIFMNIIELHIRGGNRKSWQTLSRAAFKISDTQLANNENLVKAYMAHCKKVSSPYQITFWVD